MQKKTTYRSEFEDAVKRQVEHMGLKRGFLAWKIENKLRDESAQNRAKAKMELDALDKQIDDLKEFDTWLNQK